MHAGTLTLRRAVHCLQERYGWRNKTRTIEVVYEDWMFDGQSLRDLICAAYPDDLRGAEVSLRTAGARGRG